MVPIGSSSRISICAPSPGVWARIAGAYRATSAPAAPAAAVPMNGRRVRLSPQCEHPSRLVAPAGPQHGGREVRMVRRIGEMLRLEAQRGTLLIHAAALAGDRAVEEVPGVELQARLGRRHVERTSARRILELRRVAKRALGWSRRAT